MRHDGQLATLDAGLTSLVSKNEVDSVYVIPVWTARRRLAHRR